MDSNDGGLMFRRGFFWRLRGILFVYFALGLLLLPLFFWQLDADGISYISIARRYMDGDFGGALNGYWGPLLSWALAAFMSAGIEPLAAAKLFGLICGGALVWGLHRLMRTAGCTGKLRAVLLYAFLPAVYSYFCNIISPDLAAVVFTVWYLVWVTDRSFVTKPYAAVYCGFTAALAFFSKSYALPFFLAHFTLVNALRWFSAPALRTAVINRWIAGLLTFFFVAAPWIIAVSYKYGPVTFSTAGRYNAAIVGPAYSGHPINYEGLFAPKDLKALSVWEDPSYIPVRSWSVLTLQGFTHQLKLVAENTLAGIRILELVSLFSIIVLGWLLLKGFKEAKNGGGGREPVRLYLGLAALLYFFGYTLITVRARYLYPVFAIVFAGGAGLAAAVLRSGRAKPVFAKLAVGLFAASFLYVPLDNLKDAVNSGRGYYVLSKKIASMYAVSGNIASDSRWMETLYVTYWLNDFSRRQSANSTEIFKARPDTGYPDAASRPPRYRGQLRGRMNARAAAEEFDRHGVDYFFAWDGGSPAPAGWTEITNGKPPVAQLRIYRRTAVFQ